MLLFSCHSLTTSSSAFVLIFFPLRPSVSFPLPSLRGGSQQGSVLIRPGKRSGDNRPAADIRHCALPLPGSRAVGVSRRSRWQTQKRVNRKQIKKLLSSRGWLHCLFSKSFLGLKGLEMFGLLQQSGRGGLLNKKLSCSIEWACDFQHQMIISLFFFLFFFCLRVSFCCSPLVHIDI